MPSHIPAQTPGMADLLQRFEILEAETKSLRAEVARLNAEKAEAQVETQGPKSGTPSPFTVAEARSETSSVPSSGSSSGSSSLPITELPSSTEESENETESKSPSEVLTLAAVDDFIDQHIRDNAWKAGPLRVVPYGKIWASMLITTSQTAGNDILGCALPNDTYGRTSTTFQARTSRLGVKVDSPDLELWGGLRSSGIVEFDFRGSVTKAENKGSVMFREAYWQLENDDMKILFGQTKDVISPLFSSMFDYNALLGVGNIGYRTPMVSFTRYLDLNPCVRMEVTSALSMLCGSDYDTYDVPGSYPTYQGRVGWIIKRPGIENPIKFGISGHIGEQCYDFPSESTSISSWSADLDLILPITNRFCIRSEFFTGQGLAGVFGGSCQSIDYNPVTRMGTMKSIHSTGGWVEFLWDWTDKMQYRMGYSIDDPNDSDMEVAKVRLNSMIYANVIYDFTKYQRFGLQYSYTKTDYCAEMVGGTKGRSHGVEWMWQLSF